MNVQMPVVHLLSIFSNLRLRYLIALALILTLLLWPLLYCLLAIVYNYLYWVIFSSAVRIASPHTVPKQDNFSLNHDDLLVPKILHQTWRDKEVPEKWKEAQASCRQLHADYEYRLWTDEEAERFIESKFPWFMETYRSYPYDIQRVDAFRYFVLNEFGGIYLDLDVKCLKPLDFLRHFSFTAPKTYPIGLSNDVLVSRPKDPFSHRLIHNLAYWNRWFAVKYATVMFSTGPMFVTVQYALDAHAHQGVTMLPKDLYGKYDKGPSALMQHLHGSSWHGKDARLVFWVEKYWIGLVLLGSFALLGLAAWAYCHHTWGVATPVGIGKKAHVATLAADDNRYLRHVV